MARKKRKTPEEKLSILKEGELKGVLETCRKHGISETIYYVWRERFEEGGYEALKPKGRNGIDPELARLREENARLKKLLAEKELALEIKEELVKKTLQRKRSG
jgi:putative transposase